MQAFDPSKVFVFGSSEATQELRQLDLAKVGPQIDVVVERSDLPSKPSELSGMFADGRRSMSALVDTGASVNVIDNKMARRLGLRIVDHRMMSSAGGIKRTPVYAAKIVVPALGIDVAGEVFGGDLKTNLGDYKVLLGRGFLRDFNLSYDGADGRFYLVHKDDRPGPVTP